MDSDALDLADIAASSGTLADRGQRMVERLRRVIAFDAAWLALADPLDGPYRSLVAIDLDAPAHRYLAGPRTAADLATWAEHLLPTGFHESLAAALLTADGRHVGFLALLSASSRAPTPTARRRLHRLTPILAGGVDPLRSLAGSARLLAGAVAGVAVCRDGSPRPLPGLAGDPVLVASPLLALASERLRDGPGSSFLWPRGDPRDAGEHVRVTVIASPVDSPSGLLGAVVLSPATDLRGLTPRELQVLGMVVEGRSNQQIAHALVVSARTVATHVEHVLAKLDAPSRTLAAVRAERRGLYVPWPPP